MTAPAVAAPARLEDRATPTPIAAAAPIPWAAAALPGLREMADPEFIRAQPARVAAFLEAAPARLDPTQMTPEAALQAAEILMVGGRAFTAERLLSGAYARWADRPEVCLAYARALLYLGQPAALPSVLAALLQGPARAEQLEAHYLLARALGERGRSAETDARIIEHLELILSRDPRFRASDGATAAGLRALISSLRAPKATPG
ncbi:hypothetical protein KKF91_13800 [Myxococcota bacterium]|nr:hypothetical protein [Myxococcota bacterium]MBU1431612.1 hypothetical protein [Myxococcota bacterium]MBU1898694.1 hypothetical protein [Myxococcota bacterium]